MRRSTLTSELGLVLPVAELFFLLSFFFFFFLPVSKVWLMKSASTCPTASKPLNEMGRVLEEHPFVGCCSRVSVNPGGSG